VTDKQFEIEALQEQVDDLVHANGLLRDERDNLRDAAVSLAVELDQVKSRLNVATATVDRLRLHIQQGVEL
jgi:regulator of replication initiation timing